MEFFLDECAVACEGWCWVAAWRDCLFLRAETNESALERIVRTWPLGFAGFLYEVVILQQWNDGSEYPVATREFFETVTIGLCGESDNGMLAKY